MAKLKSTTITVDNAVSDLKIQRDGTNISTSTDIGNLIFESDHDGSFIPYARLSARSNDISSVRGSLDLEVKSTSGNILTGLSLYGTSSGVNVGVGTTTPNANLSLVSSANTTPPGLGSLGSNFLMTKSDGGANGNYGLLAGVSGSGWSWFQAQRVDGTATAYALNLQPSGGNVGIGTTAPSQKLDVEGNIKLQNNGSLYMFNTDNYIKYNYWRVNTGSNVNIFNQGNSDIVLSTNNAEKMRITAGGGVGIGRTPDASYKLDVDGDIRITGDIKLAGDPTTTNQGLMIDFTGFDKEGTTDFSDRAYIEHTTNFGGHSGSVLKISSRNDSNDGIAFDTHGSSQIKHNSYNLLSQLTGVTAYHWTVSNINYIDNGGTDAGYRKILDITTSDQLGVGGILYATGTSGSVVINAKFEVLVNHSADIVIKSMSGGYTNAFLKVQSNNNEHCEFLFARDRNDTNDTPVDFTFIPFRWEDSVTTHTNSPTPSYSSSTLEHGTKLFGTNINATGGSTSTMYVEGLKVLTTTVNDTISIGANTIDFNANSGNSTTAQIIGDRSATDLDTRNFTTEGGFSYTTFDGSTSNKPSGSYNNANGVITMNTHSGAYNWQLAFTNNQGKMFARYRNGGSYSSWNEILTSATSVNADTLDNLDSTQFLRSDADDSYNGTLSLGSTSTIKLPNSASYGIRTSTGHRVIDSVDATLRIGDTGKHSLITLHGQDGDDFKVYYGATHYQIWHEGNDGTGSGLSADNLRGYLPQESASANSIAKRDGNGDLRVRDIRADGAVYANFDQGNVDAYVYFADTGSQTAHWIRFDTSAQQFGLSNRLVGTAGRLGAIEYNGSDVDKVNFALSGSTLTITTS